CIQCNQCAFVCPHATIRPFALTDEELAAAPAQTKHVPVKGKVGADMQYVLAVSPLDCMGCGLCVIQCPTDSLTMKPIADTLDEQPVFDYCVSKVARKPELEGTSVKASQFKQPLLEFSGSCAGCAQTSYARLVTQLFGDRMYIANATGCSSIWGGPAATSPYTVNADGHGPAWSNSLFEDNAEHGMGMLLGYEAVQDKVVVDSEALIECGGAAGDLADAARAWLEARADAEASKAAAEAYVAALSAAAEGTGEVAELAAGILANKEYLTKKSVWIFGGDGWAYDIGYGGLDHVLASGKDVNVFVFDTEVYSNTGGQASKASNLGQVAQFAAAGKDVKKKSLAEIAMTYGYVYVAQVAMGANLNQTIKAITEAEAYPGPSLIIGYSPCEMHSIKGGMTNCQTEMKKAVDCGYWNLLRFNPEGAPGKKLVIDSKDPAEGEYQNFLMNEARYSRLTREFPERAEELFAENEQAAMARWSHLQKLKDLYAAE
ncbi:thiamine pyrophosphate-dependent enzyme, partial [Adlercreutzia sp.]